ncbi:MAG: hypothetical protein LBG75_03740 [Candidatus Nomurabacteria bacterium]|jgi:tRNA G10  N-methylase Trm11|nr:hypothetical protein [Candidatus Nomurabacteria bacterium]
MFIAILGRQPALGTAELEATYGSTAILPLLPGIVLVKADQFNISHFGGIKKAGKVLSVAGFNERSNKLVEYLSNLPDGKITLGFSYFTKDSIKAAQRNSFAIQNILKKQGRSVRLVPQNEVMLSTATSHHNKLGLSTNKVEVLFIGTPDKLYTAISTGAQNITAYAARDQKRPKRDAFVGMLPPKLAQIIVNLAISKGTLDQCPVSGQSAFAEGKNARLGGQRSGAEPRPYPTILDPFCGTGVVLQEALLMGYNVYGTDLSDKMVDYSRENLEWLISRSGGGRSANITLEPGDATDHRWQPPIDAIASEVYLGQPFSATPSPAKLAEVRQTCRRITIDFLTNLAPQVKPGTPLCLAVPAWRTHKGWQRLDILDTIHKLGYNIQEFKHVKQHDLLYYRESQFVGRELLVLKRS